MNDLIYCIPVGLAVLLILLAIAIYKTMPKVDTSPTVDLSDQREPIIRAAEVLEQRRYGRWCGPQITVDWTPGESHTVDAYAKWILKNPGHGVDLNITGDTSNSLSRGS